MEYQKYGSKGISKVGQKGQVVIPAGLRKKLNIVPGTEVIISGKNGKVEIKPLTGESIRAFIDSIFSKSEKEKVIRGFWAYKKVEKLIESKKWG